MSFQVLKISLIGHRKRILASLGDRLHEDPPQKPPRSITLRVSAQDIPVFSTPSPQSDCGAITWNDWSNESGSAGCVPHSLPYPSEKQSHFWLCFIRQDFFFPRLVKYIFLKLVKYIFLRFRHIRQTPTFKERPSTPTTAIPHSHLIPRERKWVFCQTPQIHWKKNRSEATAKWRSIWN